MKQKKAQEIFSQLDKSIIVSSDVTRKEFSSILEAFVRNQEKKINRAYTMIEDCNILNQKAFERKYKDFENLYDEIDDRRFTP